MIQPLHPAWHNWLARETFTNLRDLKVESSSLSVGVIPFVFFVHLWVLYFEHIYILEMRRFGC